MPKHGVHGSWWTAHWLAALLMSSAIPGSTVETTVPPAAPAATTPDVRVYRNRQERRDGSQKHPLNDWLQVAAIVNAEYFGENFRFFEEEGRIRENESGQALELEFVATPAEWIKAEVVAELSHSEAGWEGKIDEAVIAFTAGNFELEAGRLYPPFGEFTSYFATGPLLEFGETRRNGLVLTGELSARFSAAVFALDGDFSAVQGKSGQRDWGLALEYAPAEFLRFGCSYLSDLAESGFEFLEAGIRYTRRVDAWSGFAIFNREALTLSVEFVQALRPYDELDAEVNRPSAWNVELAWQFRVPVVAAVRLEGSRELDAAPRRRAGVALLWGFRPNITLAVEYLQSRYARGFHEDDTGREINRSARFGVNLSLDF